ncbi:MAG TPA: CapA family protein [Steroidobacteraceae bacterium]|nr:CapA family protein [Steroidobacteraceae bacterium]
MMRRSQIRTLACLGATLLGVIGAALAQSASGPSDDPQQFLRTPPRPASIRGDFRLVAIGDLLYSYPLAQSTDPKLRQVIQLLRGGDLTIGNREGVCFDLNTFKGHAYGDGQVWCPPAVVRDMQAIGVGMVSVANNHATDWGGEGLLDSLNLLDAAGIPYAGGGRNLAQARAAGFIETPKGRVALVSTASTFKANAGADDSFGEEPGRPGISILRTRTVEWVTAGQLAMIRRLATERATSLEPAPAPDATEVRFGDQLYRLAPQPGLHYEMNLYDEAGLLQAVRAAKRQANLVIFTIHAHETATGDDDDTTAPPDFLIKLFHEAVDAGADEIIGGGLHSLRGIEIYKGRPILYGMGLFVLRPKIFALQETVLRKYPADPSAPPEGRNHPPAAWYDGLVAVTEFKGARAVAVRLYPLDLANASEPGARGVPHLAGPAKARRILAMLQRESAPFGTLIAIEGTVGLIRIAPR